MPLQGRVRSLSNFQVHPLLTTYVIFAAAFLPKLQEVLSFAHRSPKHPKQMATADGTSPATSACTITGLLLSGRRHILRDVDASTSILHLKAMFSRWPNEQDHAGRRREDDDDIPYMQCFTNIWYTPLWG